MRARRVEEADALAVRIGKDIARRSKTRLSQTDSQTGTKDMWAAYRQLTGRKQKTSGMHGITAEFWLLNELHETGSFKDGAVSQLVEVAGKNDRRRRVIAKQLVNTRLDVIEQRVGLVEWTR